MRSHTTIFALFSALVLGLAFVSSTHAQTLDASRISIFAVEPGVRWWPVIMSATYDASGTSINVANIVFTWSFPGEADQSCTYRGNPGVLPCRGMAIEKTWLHTGVGKVVLTASIPGNPAVSVSRNFNIIASYTGPTAQRENILTMPRARWTSYVNALYTLKANGVYDHLVYQHSVAGTSGIRMGSNRNSAHRGPALLPWHRVYLRLLERAVQVASGDNTLGVPYWDWTADAVLPSGPRSSQLWTNDFLGPDGDPSQDFVVTSGPFCSQVSSTCEGRWPLLPQLNGPNLERQLGNLSASLPGSTQINRILTVTQYDGTTLDDRATASTSFRNALEGWNGGSTYGGAHNLVHMFVGGSMNPLTSPNDPAFFLHHCNVDRLWYNWQVSRGCYAACYVPHVGDGTVTSSTPAAKLVNGQWRLPGHEWESRLFPWYLHPYDVADQTNSLLSYQYIQ